MESQERSMINNQDLGPMPEPRPEEPEHTPGGVDADQLPDEPAPHAEGRSRPLGRDLPPEQDPIAKESIPDEVTAPDDKRQAPNGAAEDASDGSAESPHVEPPA
jgi:hypothetical protein